MSYPSQEPPASFKAPNWDLKDMDNICNFKIKIEKQNLEYGCTKSVSISNQYQDANPSQKPPASSKAPNQELKDMDVLYAFKIKIDSHNSEYGCTKDQ